MRDNHPPVSLPNVTYSTMPYVAFNKGIMAKKATTDEFIAKARLVHGDRYLYDSVEYTTSASKVTIRCVAHGKFSQEANSHLRGRGCGKCGRDAVAKNMQSSTEDFILKAAEVHAGAYSYESVEYVASHKAVNITCPTHGAFKQTPNAHLRGSGCLECGIKLSSDERRLTLSVFLSRAAKAHGDKYDYTHTEYIGSGEKVEIRCPTHGVFSQIVSDHLAGRGCRLCSNKRISESKKLSQDEFLAVATRVHGSKYDYAGSKYVENRAKIGITCPTHGVFSQTAASHMRGAGCPSCSKSGYDRGRPGIFYILACGEITKVGITNLTAAIRAKQVSKSYGKKFKVLCHWNFEDGAKADSIETDILRLLSEKHEKPKHKFQGHTECFLDVNIDDLLAQVESLVQADRCSQK